MKGVFGTTVSGEAVSKVVNAIMEIAQTEEGVSLEVVLTAVAQVRKVFITDAEIKKRPPKRSIY